MVMGLWDFIKWMHAYIFENIVVIAFFAMTVTYFIGFAMYRSVQKAKAEKRFEEKTHKMPPPLAFFNFVNDMLDKAIFGVVKFLYRPLHEFLAAYLSDVVLARFFNKLFVGKAGILNGSMKSREALAKDHFDYRNDAFMWQYERSLDNRQASNVIAGKFFNGRPVKDYIGSLIPSHVFYDSVRAGIIVAVLSFLVFNLALLPSHLTGIGYGWLSTTHQADMVLATEKAIKEDPSVVPALRTDEWDEAGYFAKKEKANQIAEDEAIKIVSAADGYSYHWWGNLFRGGELFSLLLSIGIGLIAVRHNYYRALKKVRIGFIADMFEETRAPLNKAEIDNYKIVLAASNRRATGFDKLTQDHRTYNPLISIFRSNGQFENQGLIGAKRKGEAIWQSPLDMSQNTQVEGAPGANKSLAIVKPMVAAILEMKNQNLWKEQEYTKFFDLKHDCLTDFAISAGYLDKYTPLPTPPISISMIIMDIKAHLWKDLSPKVKAAHLDDQVLIIGSHAEKNEYAVDLFSYVTPAKLKAVKSSVDSQISGSGNPDPFWNPASLGWDKAFADVAYLFHHTPEGEEYMKKFKVKPWSAYFHSKLTFESQGHLLAHALNSIYMCMQNQPNRLAGILTNERLKSMSDILTSWQKLGNEMKGSFQEVMKKANDPLFSETLKPFVTGVGANMLELSDIFNSNITAFNFPANEYGSSGKYVLLFLKTLIFEEAIHRQQRYSQKIMDISLHFKRRYPEVLLKQASIEMVDIAILDPASAEVLDDFRDGCRQIMGLIQQQWSLGEYLDHLHVVAKALPHTPGYDDYDAPYSVEVVNLAKEMIEKDAQFKRMQPRLATEERSIAVFDPKILEPKEGDSAEIKAEKRKDMALYYEYVDAKTRIDREHIWFIADEYQELITSDNGECLSDANFPNISRSSNFKYFAVSQTEDAYIKKIGKEATVNFMNQMRTRIFLETDSLDMWKKVEELGGKIEVFKHTCLGKELENDTVKTGYKIYQTYNSFVAECVDMNRRRLLDGSPLLEAYPYTRDVLAEIQPLEIDNSINLNRPFSMIFDEAPDFEMLSFKNHFLDTKGIAKLVSTGSLATGMQSNEDKIQDQWKSAVETAKKEYESTLNSVQTAPLIAQKNYGDQSGVQAFIRVKRAGRSVTDHVIVGFDELILQEDKRNEETWY